MRVPTAVSRTMAIALVLGIAGAASAQPQRTSIAQDLFEKAVGEMKAHDYAAACPKLEEAVKLVPTGAGAVVKLAECYEGAERLASAWSTYGRAESMLRSASDDRADWPAQRAAELRPRLSTLEIVVPVSIRNEPGAVVKLDGEPIGDVQWNSPLVIDGGPHVVRLEAPAKKPHETTVNVLTERDLAKVVLPELAAMEEAPAVVPSGPPPDPPPSSAPITPPPSLPIGPSPSTGTPAWAWTVGGVGLAAIAIGAGFRVDGYVVETDQADRCGPARDACPPSYDVEGTNARKERDYGVFVGLTIAGSLAVGTGIVGLVVSAASRGGHDAHTGRASARVGATGGLTSLAPWTDGRSSLGVAAAGRF